MAPDHDPNSRRAETGRAVTADGRNDYRLCPCGCAQHIGWRQVVCPAGWRRLPPTLRTRLSAIHRDRDIHRAAILAAEAWLRDHPASQVRGT